MTKPETNIKCEKCGHTWFTESKMIKLNCPSCRKTTTNTTIKKDPFLRLGKKGKDCKIKTEQDKAHNKTECEYNRNAYSFPECEKCKGI